MIKRICLYAVMLCSLISIVFDINCATLKITCRAKGREIDLCKQAINEWSKKTGHNVEIITLPHSSNECFAMYQQWISSETCDVDILQMDVAWLGVFSDFLISISDLFSIDTNDYFEAIKDNMFNADGKIIALPWYTDCGVMYYRKDLLEKHSKSLPKSWEELYDTALYIQEKERQRQEAIDKVKHYKFFGFVFQAKAFEVLTCFFAEILDSFGGKFVDDGQVCISSENAIDGIQFLVKCISTISSKSILNYSEEDARCAFQSGNAVFMRNWPYAWALMNSANSVVYNKIGVMPIPASKRVNGKSSGVLGGWFLTVSKYSKHKKIAADLAMFLTSKQQQKIRTQDSYAPTFKTLYSDKEVLKNNPFFKTLYHSLTHAVARPSMEFGKFYTKASNDMFNTVNTILSLKVDNSLDENVDISKLLNRLNRRLNALLKRKNNMDTKIKQQIGKNNVIFDDNGIIDKTKNKIMNIWDKITNEH